MAIPSPDKIYSGHFLLTSSKQENVIEEGGLVVRQDTIVDIGPRSDLEKRYPQAEIHHEPHGLLMPGLINCHTHAAMSCFRGIADDLPLSDWLEKHIFPREAYLNEEIVYNFTMLSIAEMIRSGTTSFCDMYPFAKTVAKAVEDSGIRSWLGEAFYDFPSPCFGKTENGFSYIKELFAHYRNHPLINITVDPHSVYACSRDLLQRLAQESQQQNCLFVIHLAESDEETQTCLQRYGSRPVEYLANLGLLNARTLAAHCVKLEQHELEILKKHDVKVVHCLESNMKLASGVAQVVELFKRGITLALGTDSCASNNNLDMFGEMNSVAKIHKVMHMDPTTMPAEKTLHVATVGGAKALGAEKSIGSLEPGKKADFIVLDLDQPHLTPLFNIPSHIVYAARGSDVIHSFVNGRSLMKSRKLLSIDEEKLYFTANKLSQRIAQIH